MVSEEAESQLLEQSVFEHCWELANQLVSTYDPELNQERSREEYLADFLTLFAQIHRVVHTRTMRPDLDADMNAISRFFRPTIEATLTEAEQTAPPSEPETP